MLPGPVAAAPWVPKRTPRSFTIEVAPDDDASFEASLRLDPTVAMILDYDGVDKYASIPEAERSEAVLQLFLDLGIVMVYGARHLSLEDARTAVRRCKPEVVAHYRIVELALVRHGLEAWDLLETVLRRNPTAALAIAMNLEMPRVARSLLQDAIHADASSRRAATERIVEYARRYPATAMREIVAALVCPAEDKAAAKDSEAARKLLLRLTDEGLGEAIAEQAAAIGDDVAREVATRLAPEPLPPKPPKMPAWWNPETMPRPQLLDGSEIDGEALQRLGELARLLPLPAARAALDEVTAACDRASLDRFARAVMSAWLEAGGVAKDKWALLASGVLGDDTSARRLAEMAHQWAAQAQHRRAALALEAIAEIGTDVALLQLDALTRVKGALKKRAVAALQAQADEKGWTREDLQDRLVPDLDLDANGRAALDFGARRFTVTFDEHFRPIVVDEDGHRSTRLPRPGGADDPELAAAAKQCFADLRKDAAAIAKRRTADLEHAMVFGRRWPKQDWRRFFPDHPLGVHYARRLIFGAYGPDGALRATFRVDDDRTLAGIDDESLELTNDVARIGIVHALELQPGDLERWGEIFADYEIIQPFTQLGRLTFGLDDSERELSRLTRFAGRSVPGKNFFGLKARGWEFPDYDIGRRLPGGFVAYLETDPGLDFLAQAPSDQIVGDLYLTTETNEEAHWGTLPDILVSEILGDVQAIL